MLAIFDMDGVLADMTHREGLRHDKKAFRAAAALDKPIKPMIALYHALLKAGYDCHIWTARNAVNEAVTYDWLMQNVMEFSDLRMRVDGNTHRDEDLKEIWLNSYLAKSWTPDLVVEDKIDCVRMFRRRGIPTLHYEREVISSSDNEEITS